jgi:NDP-sugar pyrophosphorylase family protein
VAPGEVLGLPDLVNRLLADGLQVGSFAHDGLWLDMRRREDFELAQLGAGEIEPLLPGAKPEDVERAILSMPPAATNGA